MTFFYKRNVAVFAVFLFCAGGLLQAEPVKLSLADALRMALAVDPGVQSANFDLLAAQAKTEAASWRMLPSLSVSAGYQKLSDLPAGTFMGFTLPAGLTDYYSLSASFQYPVFAGFRIREAAAIASLAADGKLISLEMARRATIFELRRTYWEAVRAANNVQMLTRNFDLAKKNQAIVQDQVAQGTATNADLLNAGMRTDQAELDLGVAVALKERTMLVLAVMTSGDAAGTTVAAGTSGFTLSTSPDEKLPTDFTVLPAESELVARALDNRPETRMSLVAARTAEHSKRLAEAGLYPTLAVTGSFVYADPNSRVVFQSDPSVWTATWALGVQLSYDLGGLLPNLAESRAAGELVTKAGTDAVKQRNTVVLDVRTCFLAHERISRELELTRRMVSQADENLRIMRQRFDAGSATTLDVLSAEQARLRSNFAVANKQIDLHIAAADLVRAAALEEVK